MWHLNIRLGIPTRYGVLQVDPQVIVHKLKVLLEAKPIRKFAPQVVEAVRQEVAKLLSVGFIEEVEYPNWVSNVVMVKKTNGK
ncbi:RNA-directed DNA polymerase-like protein [Gossypium australe]|uniref:RNA-directed DNA polymerase-like protein n=1 Tax=Gossypium australe TaxID=47621 RepID=A0A5B6VDJ4_9ROSI|nr:RNA-directed DNA polymerase-like protein [Gossypium australe]